MRINIAFALLIILAAARVASAFPTGDQFDLDPVQFDAAGGIAFTGAPRFAGHTCDVCHTDAPRRISLELQADKSDLFTSGWKPGLQYHLRVVLENEWAGLANRAAGDNCGFDSMPYKACDENGFALEMDDASGKPVGKFVPVANGACANISPAPTDVDVRVLTDGTAVTHSGLHNGLTAWDMCWTAPAAGAGTITAYLAAVDGNGGDGTVEFPNDAIGDDVASGTVPLAELGAAPPTPQTGGCAATDPEAGVAVIAVIAAWAALRRRRARIAAALAIAMAGGCVHVRPRQRETLAKKNMKFAPDPVEDELDLHMQESREGSSGGYGSSGGGCGCN
jgi:uncharacterized protein (TIGR03382 family)